MTSTKVAVKTFAMATVASPTPVPMTRAVLISSVTSCVVVTFTDTIPTPPKAVLKVPVFVPCTTTAPTTCVISDAVIPIVHTLYPGCATKSIAVPVNSCSAFIIITSPRCV